MDEETKKKWLDLGALLLEVSPEKFDEVMRGLRDVIEAQTILAKYDWQLMFRGRPRKRYHA